MPTTCSARADGNRLISAFSRQSWPGHDWLAACYPRPPALVAVADQVLPKAALKVCSPGMPCSVQAASTVRGPCFRGGGPVLARQHQQQVAGADAPGLPVGRRGVQCTGRKALCKQSQGDMPEQFMCREGEQARIYPGLVEPLQWHAASSVVLPAPGSGAYPQQADAGAAGTQGNACLLDQFGVVMGAGFHHYQPGVTETNRHGGGARCIADKVGVLHGGTRSGLGMMQAGKCDGGMSAEHAVSGAVQAGGGRCRGLRFARKSVKTHTFRPCHQGCAEHGRAGC